jgi:branched-chain amino acid transport system permease protein
LLSLVLAALAVVALVGSRTRSLKLPPRAAQGALAMSVLLFVASAYDRAGSGSEFLQFTILGIAAGSIYAIAAAGLVLTYTTTGVFNFAHGALGMISAFLYWQLKQDSGWPAPLAALVVLGIFGPILALVLELMFRRFRDADVGTSIVLTIAVTVLCIGVSQYLFKATEAHNLSFIFGQRTVTIGGATITWDNVLQIGLAIVIAIALRALLYRSRIGTGMRAVVDNPTLAALNGASPRLVARLSWIIGTELAIVAGILVASGNNLEAITLTFFVVNAYGAAVFGKLRSLPLTFAGALVLGVIQNWGSAFWFPNSDSSFFLADGQTWRRIGVSLPGIFLFLALLALPQAKLTVGRVVGRNNPRVPGLTSSLVRGVLFLGLMAVLLQTSFIEDNITDATRAMIFSVILLSLVLLTGLSGQVSLAQYVFVAIGAWAMGSWFGGDSLLGMIAAGVVAVPIGAIVALPALRLQGLYLALVTFGFASVSRDLIIQAPAFYGDGPVNVGRLHLFGVSFDSDKSFFFLCAIVFAVVGIGLLAIKRGAFGRRLAAMRDSQAACATLGLDVRRTKLAVFCLSAFIAGVAGSLFGGLQQSVSDVPFEPLNNIVLFLFAVVGGITTVSGALIGGALFAYLPYVQAKHPELAGLVFAGVAAVAIGLGRQPNGLAGLISSALDPWLEGASKQDSPAVADGVVPEEVSLGAPA